MAEASAEAAAEFDAIPGSGPGHSDAELLAMLTALPAAEWPRILAQLSDPQARELRRRWPMWGHAGQLEPATDWTVWLIRAGRGFGKTRAGAEWVSAVARLHRDAQIALVGATRRDAVKVMVEGPAGILAVAREDEPVDWRPSASRLTFASGAVAHIYSAAAPETLRGPEHDAAWCDEIAKWHDRTGRGSAAWDNLMLGLRGGTGPRCLVTTTPRTNALMKRVTALPGVVVTRGRTYDNLHLPPTYIAAVEAQYGGTRLGRQELDGELIDDHDGALFPRRLLERARMTAAMPELPATLVRVVVGVDPPASADGDACGIVACGADADGCGYVLADASVSGASPEGWARAVADCAAAWGADRVIAEKNNGGDMVASVLAAADAGLPVRLVHASRGKVARAEPVAAKYERGQVRHAGSFPALEDELAGLLIGGGYMGPGNSPDRADACVWALTELLLGRKGAVRVRGLGG